MSEPVYHWQDESGAWQLVRIIGVEERHTYGHWVGFARNKLPDGTVAILVQHLYSGILEWVPAEKLKPYPSEPIPEPQGAK